MVWWFSGFVVKVIVRVRVRVAIAGIAGIEAIETETISAIMAISAYLRKTV